jgi:Subtilase family/Bacterial Ig domain/Lamin Tail Domain/MBG domain (YGX type)
MSDPVTNARVVNEMRMLEETQNNAVKEKARQLGIPMRKEGPGNKVSMLYDFINDEPLYRTTFNANAAISSAANQLYPSPYELDGAGVKIGVWDEGSVRSTHQEFGTRVTKRNSGAADSDHGTHVAGTIGAVGTQSNAKGMAPAVSIDSYDWNSDYSEMTAAAATGPGDTARIPLSNHSYGFFAFTADMGRYEDQASTVDSLASGLPYYLPFWAAGNDQQDLPAKGGFQSITYLGLAKNVLTVGAMTDAVSGGGRDPLAGTIAEFSSLGPCDDGRIKPDIVANGVDVYSPVSTSNTSYDTYSGTSMATPSALGSASLVTELYAREFSGQRMRASMMKALLIHTADDVGNPGPDYTYGWGLINSKAAADLILAHKLSLGRPKLMEGTVTNAAKTKTHTFTWDGFTPIRATLNWTDPAGAAQTDADSRTPNLRHNLDLKITAPDGTTVYQPFVMPFVGNWTTPSMSLPAITGKNNVDTVEQVFVNSPAQAGEYVVTVSLDGSLTTASQAYSLVLTGGTEQEINPPPTVSLTSPLNGASFLTTDTVTVSATASDLALGGLPGAVSQVEFFNGATSLGVVTAFPYSVNFTPPGAGVYVLSAKATDNEGSSATSPVATIYVLGGTGVPTISSFTPTEGPANTLVVITGDNLINVTSVKFNNAEAEFVVNSGTQITATVPPLGTTGAISVTNFFGTANSASPFVILQPPVLISQIYGGAGNAGSTYNRDYVELYNRSGVSQSITGWTLQYADSNGLEWTSTPLSGTIAAGRYFLIALGTGTIGSNLPTPNVSGSTQINATAGKIALMSSNVLLSVSSPIGNPDLEDLVGYGSANAFEGSPAPSPSTTTAIFRAGAGANDADNNSVDFAVAPPFPRNTSSLPSQSPVITSPTSASATKGEPFTYQITATNSPTTYNATGLPSGLFVNALSGLISGSPTVEGIFNATITATNPFGTGPGALQITIAPGAPVATLFTENVGPGGGTSSIGINSYTGFQNQSSPTIDITTTPVSSASAVEYSAPSSGYTGASGGRYVKIPNIVNNDLKISGLSTKDYINRTLTFGLRTSHTANLSNLIVRHSLNNINWTNLTLTGLPTAINQWVLVTASGLPESENFYLQFLQNGTVATFLIDDITITGTLPILGPPDIETSGTVQAVHSVYGSTSPQPSFFSVSGADIGPNGILITPPPGFEVSKTSGGNSGYAATQTIARLSSLGVVPNTSVYVRLKSDISAGSYSGNISCSSGGAQTLVPVPSSDVARKTATITAEDRSKAYGDVLTLGSGQTTGFTLSGMALGETIDSVTLTASGGTAADAQPGNYSITPSDATGGTFNPANYDFDYVQGTLTVSGQTYNDWVNSHPNLQNPTQGFDSDGDDLTNLMEFYMALDPEQPSVSGITVNNTPGFLSMTYRRAKGISGVEGTVKWTSDLLSNTWSTQDVVETFEDMGTYQLRTATVPTTSEESRKFMRLEITPE